MSNYHLRSTNLSLKAIGLLSKVLSLPENWDYSISGLTAICKEKETAIKAALDELKHWGYLVVTKLMPTWMCPVMFLAAFVCGILGGLLGRRLMKKHFEKAGIA